MATSKDRVLFIGTANGLYRATPAGEGYETELVGLKDRGFIRSPIVVDVSDPNRMYAGATRGGVFASTDGGATWQESSRGIVHRDIWCIVQHPRTGTLYAGASPASVYVSTDHGESWTECESLGTLKSTRGWTGPQPPHVSRMKCLDVAQDDPDLIFGAIEEGWAVRSRDGGKTWEQIDSVDHDGHMIAVMRDDPSVVVTTTGKGMFRSTDGGDTWAPANDGLGGLHYTPAHLAIHPARPNVLYTVVTQRGPGAFMSPEGPGASFCRSENQGASWELLPHALPELFHGVPRSMAVDPESPDTYYAGMIDGSVWSSQDGGDSYRPIITGLPQVTGIRAVYR